MLGPTRLVALLAAATLAGCDFDSSGSAGGSGSDAGGDDDAGKDSDGMRAFLCSDWKPRHFDPCQLDKSDQALVLNEPGTYVYDTTARTLASPDGTEIAHTSQTVGEVVIVNADEITIGAGTTLRGDGSLPLVLASWTAITVNGTIDVSSTATLRGAGANSTLCGASNGTPGEDDGGGAGGGGGGGFGAPGGTGGIGDSNQDGGGPGSGMGLGGTAGGAVEIPTVIRGGCPGGRGGVGNMGSFGTVGRGGGAIELAAFQGIAVGGTVHAGGEGGGADDDGAGGGGGGSGGYIGLDAPLVEVSNGTLAANGGGGGGGGDTFSADSFGDPGAPGGTSATRATGGNGAPFGTDGGLGGAGATAGGQSIGVTAQGGGGGGGGGVGYILVFAPAINKPGAVISPTEIVVAPTE